MLIVAAVRSKCYISCNHGYYQGGESLARRPQIACQMAVSLKSIKVQFNHRRKASDLPPQSAMLLQILSIPLSEKLLANRSISVESVAKNYFFFGARSLKRWGI